MLAAAGLLLPSERQIRRRNDLDEVHEVESLLGGGLLGVVERVDVVVCPSARACVRVLLLHVCDDSVAELRAEAEVVDLVREGMRLVFEVVLEVVDVHVPVGEGLAWCDVEVSDDFVDLDGAFETAAFFALGVQVLGVVLALALFNAFAAAKGPAYGSVGIADIVAGVAAAGLDGIGGGRCAVTFTTVVGVEMRGLIFMPKSCMSRCEQPWAKIRSYRSRALISIAWLPSLSGDNRTLFTPCDTPICSSPDTSMTSSVSSSHGMRGKVMFMEISIFSPVTLSACLDLSSLPASFTNLGPCPRSTPVAR